MYVVQTLSLPSLDSTDFYCHLVLPFSQSDFGLTTLILDEAPCFRMPHGHTNVERGRHTCQAEANTLRRVNGTVISGRIHIERPKNSAGRRSAVSTQELEGPPLAKRYALGDRNISRLKRNMHARAHTSPKSKRHRKLTLYFAVPITSYRVVRFQEPRRIERFRVLE